jgi:hypothetical protein
MERIDDRARGVSGVDAPILGERAIGHVCDEVAFGCAFGVYPPASPVALGLQCPDDEVRDLLDA